MTTLQLFITILAWVGLVGGALMTGLRIYGALTYTELKQALDQFKGVRATFPLAKPLLTAVVCGAWLIAAYVGK